MSGYTGFHDLRRRDIHGYGWRRDIPDHRDQLLRLTTAMTMPAAMDVFAQHNPPVLDQGPLGSCVGNGTAEALQFAMMIEKLKQVFTPSRLFIYYCGRLIEGTVSSDAGMEIRDGIKAIAKLGAPPETDWPYDVSKFADKPPMEAYKDALGDKALTYFKVAQTLPLMKACLVSGYPFIIGISVYESFESDQVAQTGAVPLPKPDEELLGGHCMLVYGYDDKTGVFKVRNSWGVNWGSGGNCTLPYAYLTNANLASDFWTIRLVGK